MLEKDLAINAVVGIPGRITREDISRARGTGR